MKDGEIAILKRHERDAIKQRDDALKKGKDEAENLEAKVADEILHCMRRLNRTFGKKEDEGSARADGSEASEAGDAGDAAPATIAAGDAGDAAPAPTAAAEDDDEPEFSGSESNSETIVVESPDDDAKERS